MKLKKSYRIIIALAIMVGFPFIFITTTLAGGAKACAGYFDMACSQYNYIKEECHCEGQKLHLNNSMIQIKNQITIEQNKVFSPVTKVTLARIEALLNSSK